MDKFIHQLHTAKNTIRFEADRKAAVRSNLVRFIEASEHALPPQPAGVFTMFSRRLAPMFAAILVITLLGGGTSFAAQGSLPGDVLYAVKVGVNEKVTAVIKFTEEAKASYEAELAGRRLSEAEQLTARGGASDETRAELETRFAAHAERAQQGIAKVRERGDIQAAAAIASRFELRLESHQRLLSGRDAETQILVRGSATATAPGVATASEPNALLVATDTATATDVGATGGASGSIELQVEAPAPPDAKRSVKKNLRVKVQSALDGIHALRLELESEINARGEVSEATRGRDTAKARDDAREKIRAAEHVIAESRTYIERTAAELGAAATASAAARLLLADQLVLNAKAKLDAGEYGEAFNLANHAKSIAEEAKLLIKAKTEFNVDIDLPGGVKGWLDVRGTSSAPSGTEGMPGGAGASGSVTIQSGNVDITVEMSADAGGSRVNGASGANGTNGANGASGSGSVKIDTGL